MAEVQNAKAPAPKKAGAGASDKALEGAGEAGSTGEAPTPEPGSETPPEGAENGSSDGSDNGGTQPPAKPRLPTTERPYLDTPHAFGVHHEGLLHRFPKGKTKISESLADYLETEQYVADNGAEVVR